MFSLVGSVSGNLLVGGSSSLLVFSHETRKVINSVCLDGAASDFRLLRNGATDECCVFRVEQNLLALAEIRCGTLQSQRNFVFETQIKKAIPHPSGDFVLILDEKDRLGVFDLVNVRETSGLIPGTDSSTRAKEQIKFRANPSSP